MFIEKYGKALKTAKETAVQNTTNTSNISTTNTNINTTSGVVNNLLYLNTSYNETVPKVNQLQSDYNNLADRLSCDADCRSDLYFDYTLPTSGTGQLTNFLFYFNKSYGTKLILSLGLTYVHRSYGGGNAFKIYYDLGAGWVFWDNFNYEVQDYAEFKKFYLVLSNVESGSKTVRVGVSDLTGNAGNGEIASAAFAVYEIS